MSTSISRADFLKGMAGLAAAGLGGAAVVEMLRRSKPHFPVRMLGPSKDLGHLLRDPRACAAKVSGHIAAQKTRVAIIGGGIAGLSAAWWLTKNGINQNEIVLLELEKSVGGNATCGQNQYGSYPWGAHYIPIPNKESAYVRLLLQELGVLQGFDAKGEPIYDELALCHEPQERLYKDGAFHEGLVPKRGLQANESAEMARFFATVVAFRNAVGKDGKPAFAIPLDLSSQDSEYTALDKISMSQWLTANNFVTKPLLWYLNYCCRDDYGSTLDNVSAWAGIHYFAGRRGTAANAEQNAVLTWPQGNGFLVEKLRAKVAPCIKLDSLVTKVETKDGKIQTTFMNADGNQGTVESDNVIFAAPRFIAERVVADQAFKASFPPEKSALNYAPWLVANISLKYLPTARGVGPAWDNVSYYGQSLGYVMANHQDISTRQKPDVITYYYPLSAEAPGQARRALYSQSADYWSRIIVEDLAKMHADIAEQIISIDVWPWGHGMIRPDVGFIWGDLRRRMKDCAGNIVFAHSDMSGISNFEEAQYHGVEAAKTVLGRMNKANG
jgi:monoamine oxidase